MKRLYTLAEIEAKKQDYEVALKQYYVEIDAAKECHYRGDNDGVRLHRDAARELQKEITSYLFMSANTIRHDYTSNYNRQER